MLGCGQPAKKCTDATNLYECASTEICCSGGPCDYVADGKEFPCSADCSATRNAVWNYCHCLKYPAAFECK